MSSLEKLEAQLDEWLNKKAPVKLPPDARKGLAGALWWIALVVGILQLWGVWVLWHLGHVVDRAYNVYVSNGYGAPAASLHLGLFYWISVLALAVVAVMLLLAAPKLKQMQKGGWNLLFYAALLNVFYAVIRLFSGVNGVFSGFLGAAVGAVLGAYFLFQVRDYFSGKKTHVSPDTPHADSK